MIKKILFNLFLVILIFNCKINPPCSAIDSSCNLVSSILLENVVKNSRDPKTNISFTPAPSSYKFDQFVKINSSVSGLNIRYAINQSVSCNTGSEYNPTRLIQISPTIVDAKVSNPTLILNVVACKNGGLNSSASGTYTIRNSVKQINNIQFWYSASSLDLEEGQSVNFLTDLSDNKNDLNGGSKISDDNSKNPTFVKSAINNLPAIKFNKNNGQFLYKTRITNLTPSLIGTSIVLIRKAGNTSNENFFSIGGFSNSDSSLATRIFGIKSNSLIEHCSKGNCVTTTNDSTTTMPLNQFVLVISDINASGNPSYNIANSSAGSNLTPAFSSFASIDQITIGVEPNLNTDYLEGEIIEAFHSKTVLNDLQLLGCYFNEKYKTTITVNSCPE